MFWSLGKKIIKKVYNLILLISPDIIGNLGSSLGHHFYTYLSIYICKVVIPACLFVILAQEPSFAWTPPQLKTFKPAKQNPVVL